MTKAQIIYMESSAKLELQHNPQNVFATGVLTLIDEIERLYKKIEELQEVISELND